MNISKRNSATLSKVNFAYKIGASWKCFVTVSFVPCWVWNVLFHGSVILSEQVVKNTHFILPNFHKVGLVKQIYIKNIYYIYNIYNSIIYISFTIYIYISLYINIYLYMTYKCLYI